MPFQARTLQEIQDLLKRENYTGTGLCHIHNGEILLFEFGSQRRIPIQVPGPFRVEGLTSSSPNAHNPDQET